MGKRSQRRPRPKEQGGCISGLISMFDFRLARSTRKLLVDKRLGGRQAVSTRMGSSSRVTPPKSKDKHKKPKEDEESEMAKADAAITSVKELMEEDMVNDQVPMKQVDVSKVRSDEFYVEHGNRLRRRHRRRSRSSTKSIDMDIYDWDMLRSMEHLNLPQHMNEQKISGDFNADDIVEELRQIHHGSADSIRNDLNSYPDMQSDQGYAVVQEKLSAAIAVLMSHTLDDGKHPRNDGKTHDSMEFMDALQTISSYKDLFLKLLQDPNSLLAKQIKGLEVEKLTNDKMSNSLPRSNLSGEASMKVESAEPTNHKNHTFFQRRSKSQGSYPFEREKICHSSSKIVILKPGTAGAQYAQNENSMTTSLHSRDLTNNKVGSGKHPFYFSFTEIKRRLKHAMGKDRQQISSQIPVYEISSEHKNRGDTGKAVGGESSGWSSPNRNHFYIERFARPSKSFRRVDTIGKEKDAEATIVNESTSYHNPRASNLYLEAKRHLSEMLNNGEASPQLLRGKLLKPLGRILSLPDYTGSEKFSSENVTGDSFIASRTRLSPLGSSCGVNDDVHQPVSDKLDGYLSSSEQSLDNETHLNEDNYYEVRQSPDANQRTCEVICDNAVEETFPEDIIDIDRTAKTTGEEDYKVSSVPETSLSTTISIDVNDDIVASCIEETPSQCSQLRLVEEKQGSTSPPASPPHPSVSEVEHSEKVIERTDRPSPVSVLEPLFSEDDFSPANTIKRQVEQEICPRKIHFEEHISSSILQEICMDVEDSESPFDYVEAVLLGSDLNWDDYLLRWFSSDQILDHALLDEVELFSSCRHEQKLLLDCTSEVLKDVCDHYFGQFIGISFDKRKFRPAPRGMDLINDVWEGVERNLVQYSKPTSVDQILKKDVARAGMWTDLHLELRQVGIEMQEAIFEELLKDTVSVMVDSSSESVPTALPVEPHETEISIAT